jgi:hypothetical protein
MAIRDSGPPYIPDPDYSWGDITQADVCWGDQYEPNAHVAGTSIICRKCTVTSRGNPT